MQTSTKTGKITLFCGCKGALIFWFLRAERKKLPQKRVKLPFFVEVGYFFLLRGSLKRLFCGSLKRSSCGACRRAAAFLFYSCRCGGGSVLSRAVFVASDFKVGAGAGCDVLHEFHGDGFVGGVCAVGFDVLQVVEGRFEADVPFL